MSGIARSPQGSPPSRQSCRSCVYWGKPIEHKARAHAIYSCTAPLPEIKLPESVTRYHSFRAEFPRYYMERDAGTECPCWAKKRAGA